MAADEFLEAARIVFISAHGFEQGGVHGARRHTGYGDGRESAARGFYRFFFRSPAWGPNRPDLPLRQRTYCPERPRLFDRRCTSGLADPKAHAVFAGGPEPH